MERWKGAAAPESGRHRARDESQHGPAATDRGHTRTQRTRTRTHSGRPHTARRAHIATQTHIDVRRRRLLTKRPTGTRTTLSLQHREPFSCISHPSHLSQSHTCCIIRRGAFHFIQPRFHLTRPPFHLSRAPPHLMSRSLWPSGAKQQPLISTDCPRGRGGAGIKSRPPQVVIHPIIVQPTPAPLLS